MTDKISLLVRNTNLDMNKYEIIGIMGEGAYGIVYKAKIKESGEMGNYSSLIIIILICHLINSGDQEIQRER